MNDLIQAVTDSTFDAMVLQSEMPVLVDFWASWCGPCKAISMVLEDVAASYADQVKIMKMDMDGSTEVPVKYAIRNIPTLMFFAGGELLQTKVGSLTKSELVALLDSNLASIA